MPNTSNLNLPLLEASQAQKHVTVNEALIGVDALSQLVLQATREIVPPTTPSEGTVYAIPAGALAPWTDNIGQLAVFVNGGWAYFGPKPGWRAWSIEDAADVVFDGFQWRATALGTAPSGAASDLEPIEFTHVLTPGSISTTDVLIPASSVVFGVTGRVVSEVTGTLSSWRLGVSGSDDRYGTGLGSGLNSYARGLTSTPLAYYEDTPLVLSAEGGDFAGGEVKLVIHLMQFTLPTLV